MPTASKKSQKKTPATKAKQNWLIRSYTNIQKRVGVFLKRRPHRSFRMTRRRDYVRPLVLPGLFSFTHEVTRTVWKYKKTFLLLGLVYIVVFIVLVGLQSQETYANISDTLKETGEDLFTGGWGAIGQAGILLFSIASLNGGTSLTEVQQVFSVLAFIMIWLTTVWLLRNLLAGHKVKLRDGLYNAGSPLFAMIMVVLMIAVQLIPVGIALIGYSAALGSGLITGGGVPAMLFWIAAAFLALLSLYWITSSLFAMVIVTLPGMYPYRAIRTAGDIMVGRRIKVLLRWLWMVFVIAVAWAIVLIPIILFDMWIKSVWGAIAWLPLVPFVIVVAAAATTIWMSAYIYLLYRKVVEYVPEK